MKIYIIVCVLLCALAYVIANKEEGEKTSFSFTHISPSLKNSMISSPIHREMKHPLKKPHWFTTSNENTRIFADLSAIPFAGIEFEREVGKSSYVTEFGQLQRRTLSDPNFPSGPGSGFRFKRDIIKQDINGQSFYNYFYNYFPNTRENIQ